MRRVAIAALSLGLVVGLLAAPAAAQPVGLRDPFDPLIETGTEAQPGPGGGTETQPGNGDGDGAGNDGAAGPVVVDTEGLPNTGTDAYSWLALAYAAIALGGAALTLSWAARARTMPFRSS